MPKRRAASHASKSAQADTETAGPDPENVQRVQDILQQVDQAVEERCQAVLTAAQQIADSFMLDIRSRLLAIPKKDRDMLVSEYNAGQGRAGAGSSAVERVRGRLAALEKESVAAATAAPATRSLRNRAVPMSVVPATTRVTRRRPAAPPPKFAEAPAGDAPAAEPGPASMQQPPPPAAAAAVAAARECTPVGDGDENAATTSTAAAAAGAGGAGRQALAPSNALDNAQARAEAKVAAKMAALDAAAAGGGAGAGTEFRRVAPGERLYSSNGSPIDFINFKRGRGRGGALPLATPALANSNTSALGSFTLLKKEGVKGRAAAAAGGRGRKADAAAPPADTSILIQTAGGHQYEVDGVGSLDAIPEEDREEVKQQLQTLQRLAAVALGV